MTKKTDDQYSEQETERRREAALKRMLSTPRTPHKPLEKKKTRRAQGKKDAQRGSD